MKETSSPLGFESTLWAAADKLRNNLDVAVERDNKTLKGVLPKDFARGTSKGFCKSATTEEIKSHGYVLTPGPLCRRGGHS